VNKFNTAHEDNFSTCLPPEAYLRIIKSCTSDEMPEFASTVYPSKKTPVKKVEKLKKKS
jgi:hypothetical protein